MILCPFKKMHLKVLSEKWWPFCLGLADVKHISSTDILPVRKGKSKRHHWCSTIYSNMTHRSVLNFQLNILTPEKIMKSLWPSDSLKWHRSWPKLARQVFQMHVLLSFIFGLKFSCHIVTPSDSTLSGMALIASNVSFGVYQWLLWSMSS